MHLRFSLTLAFFFFYLTLSAQILKTDSVQKVKLFNALELKRRYTPAVNVNDVDIDDYSELTKKGYTLYEVGKYADAYKLFKHADTLVEKHVNNPNLRQVEKQYISWPLFMMAMCELKLEHEHQAYTLLREVIEKDPLNVSALDELGSLYITKLRYDSAIVQFKKAIRVNARFEPAYYHLAYAYYKQKQYSSAKTTLLTLISINPRDDQYYLLQAYIDEDREMFIEAEKEYTTTIATNETEGKNYYYRGAFFMRRKRYTDAVADFRQSYQKDTTDLASLAGLTTALMFNSEFGEGAAKLYQQLKRTDTTSSAYRMDYALVEVYDILRKLHNGSVDSVERNNAIRILGYIYQGGEKNKDTILKLVDAFPSSEINVRLYFLSLYVSGDHERFKYQVYKLQELNKGLPNTYMMEATLTPHSISDAKRAEAVKKAIALNGKNQTYYYYQALLNPIDDDNCKLNIDKALSLDPKFDKAYMTMGRIYQYREQHDSAAYYFNMGIVNTDSKAEGYYLLGSCYLEKNRRDSALFCLTKAIRLYPEFYDAYMKRSTALLLYERFVDAHKDIDTVLKVFPAHPDALDQRAKIFAAEKKYDEALKIYKQMLRKYPDDPLVFMRRGSIYFGMKKYDLAIADFKTTLTYWPYHTTALRRAATTCLAMKDSGEAFRYFKRVLELKKNGFIGDYIYSGSVYTEAGYYDEAVKFYGYALKSNAKHPTANGNLGWVYYKKADYENCIKYSKKAIEYDSTTMYAKFNIALCKLRTGEIEQAKILYKDYTEQSLRLGFPKPEGAMQDLKDLIALAIHEQECQQIIDEMTKVYANDGSEID